MGQGGGRPGVGNHGHPELALTVTTGHGEADAIDGDAGLLTDIAAIGGVVPAQHQTPGGRLPLDCHHGAQPIDMATHQVAAEPVAEPQGRLQVHGRPGCSPGGQGGANQGLLADVGPESIGETVRHSEAHAIHCDAVTQGEGPQAPRGGIRRPRLEAQPHPRWTSLQPAHGPHQSGEHACLPCHCGHNRFRRNG